MSSGRKRKLTPPSPPALALGSVSLPRNEKGVLGSALESPVCPHHLPYLLLCCIYLFITVGEPGGRPAAHGQRCPNRSKCWQLPAALGHQEPDSRRAQSGSRGQLAQ